MTLAKVKEQDGMTLAKVKEQDGMTIVAETVVFRRFLSILVLTPPIAVLTPSIAV